MKRENKPTPVFEGFDVNSPMPRDYDNQNLSDDQLYGDIPQNASISMFKKAELKGATANPDAIPIADGDAHGNGGGPQLTLTDIPAQEPPPDDIEAVLNDAVDAPDTPDDGTDGFTSDIEGFGVPTSIPGVGGLTKQYDTTTPQGAAAQQAQNMLQAKGQEAADKAKAKLQKAVMKRLKNNKIGKMAGKAVAKAKAIALKGMKKVTQKITGLLAKKVGTKLGVKASEGMFKKIAAKISQKVAVAIGKSSAKAAALSSNPFTAAIGIMLTVITAIATAVGIALPIILKGDEGVCEPGWRKVSAAWPSFLDNIPGVGDVMGAIGSYLCFLDACDANEQEDAGLCYDKCDKGYNGIGPVCWANKHDSNAKAPAKTPCPSNMRDDGTSCWLDTRPNGVGTIPRTYGGGCSGGGCHTEGWNTHCDPIHCDPIGHTCDNKAEVAGLCYDRCPSGYHFAGGNLCEPDGGPGIKKTMMDRQYCPDSDREMAHIATTIDQQCYTKCPSDTPYRVPGMPYICSAAKEVGDGRGKTSYGRGVGRPKLKLKMVTKTPPPPPPPSPWMSLAFADDPDNTVCKADFSDVGLLQDMCDFYYASSVTNANVNADGTVAFGYITKITKVIGSSEQSADVLCDITNVVVNMDTGKTVSTTVAPGSDRRFYFAKIGKICKFIVVGATNTNKTAPDITTAQPGDAKDLNFTPLIQKCANIPIGIKKCQGQDSIDAMIAMYKKTLPPTVRIKSIDAAQDSGTDVCAVAWKEVTYDPATNLESTPAVKVGNFKFLQDKSTDACAYKLQSYSPGDATMSVKALAKPVTYDAPVPPEVSLQGCTTSCKDPIMVQKLVTAFNGQPGSNRILDVTKVVTPSPLRCDIEADVFIGQTKATEKQRIRFDLTKDQASCVFTVKTVGAGGTGSFIQNNTPALGSAINTKDMVIANSSDAVKSAQTNLAASAKKITDAQGLANTAYEKVFSQFGQVETLGSCPKKCSDPDVLNAIITYYNNANYPKTRTGVTKKTIGRVLKAGTAGTNICDVLFEEKQETYGDLYTDTPTVNVTQKTQRFTMQDTGGCQFTVASAEGFSGLPMSTKEGFATKTPSVVNNVTPSLTPPYTGTGCQLDCTNADVLRAMKQKYQSANIEGFSGRRGMRRGVFGGLFAMFSEAFQDVSDGTDTSADATATDGTADGSATADGTTDTATPDWNAGATDDTTTQSADDTTTTDAAPTPVKVVHSTNMKKVNKALKLGIDKCEFEVVYDSTDTDANGNTTSALDTIGYFTGIFTKDPTGCSFSPSQVTKSATAVIPTVPSTKTANISFSF